MAEKRNVELTIEKAREWYHKGGELKEVALQAFSEQEILKNTHPKTWGEYCHTRLDSKETRFGYTIGNVSQIVTADWDNCCSCSAWRDVLPTKELAEAFLALMQLMSLRAAWVGDWKPNTEDDDEVKFCILPIRGEFSIEHYRITSRTLSFPTHEMAKEFLDCFKDLIETAKPLIG